MIRRRFLVVLLAAALLLLTQGIAVAMQEPIEIEWSTEPPLSGNLIGDVVVVDSPDGGIFPITVIENPPLHGGDIVVHVDVAVREAGSPGFLELWAVYADGGRYFSRTFDAAGVGLLQTDVIRTVELPFALDGTAPTALELNLVLPDGGTVEIGTVTLFEVEGGLPPESAADDEWWSGASGGTIGAVAGIVLGVLGALLGYLVSRGRARRFVTAALRAAAIVGVIAAGAGAVALFVEQPYHVWFPLVLTGFLLIAIFGSMLRTIPTRYETLELQKIRAYDIA